MALPSDINFAPGVTVVITMSNALVFGGELVDSTDGFIQLKLVAVPPPPAGYVAGQVVLLNVADITAIA